MLVRDGASGPEVFMLRRTLDAAFAGGMYVFPGGRVDDADRVGELEAICDGLDDARASASAGRTHRLSIVSPSSWSGSCACGARATTNRVSNRRASPTGVIQWLT